VTESFNLNLLEPYLNVSCQVELKDMAGLHKVIGHIKRFKLEASEKGPPLIELDLVHPLLVDDLKVRYYLGFVSCKLQEIGCIIRFV
jgi:hypothetical protein